MHTTTTDFEPPQPPVPGPVLQVEPDLRARFDQVHAAPQDAWRHEPITRKVAFAERETGASLAGAPEPVVDQTLERIFSTADFLAGWWLSLGVKRAGAVAKIVTDRALGTGFLVSPWLLLTNHHVLDSVATASGAEVLFRYEEDPRGRISRSRRVTLEPQRCFVSSPVQALDFTLVAVSPVGGKPPGRVFGCIPLVGSIGKAVIGQPVNIVQHPSGRPREICVRNNLLVDLPDDRFLLYGTDTEPGSSGSPVLNDHWELIALHCASEPRRNAQSQPVDVDGAVATAGTPATRRAWLANKGVRVSAIVRELAALEADDTAGSEARVLLTELLATGGNPG